MIEVSSESLKRLGEEFVIPLQPYLDPILKRLNENPPKEQRISVFVTGINRLVDFVNNSWVKEGSEIGEVKETPQPSFIITDPKGRDRVDIDLTSDYIIDKHDIKTIYGLREEVIFVYDSGIWTPTGKGLIKAECEALLGINAKNNIVNEILEKIKRKTEMSQEDFNKTPEFKVCLENGVLDIKDPKNIKFLEHSKEYHFTKKISINYNPEAKCPLSLLFINDTFYPEDILQVQEWLGLHLSKRYLFKKAVIVHGAADTGKSVFLNLLKSFLGHQNVSGLSLQKISIGKGFDVLALREKLANIYDDLSSRDLQDGGGFKMAVGDGEISGEEKFGDHINFRNSAKMTFSCNKIPSVKDVDDDAYYGRWLVWALDNIVSKEDKNPKLIESLTTPEELSGLLNWAIEGYKRLMSQNGFSNEKSSPEIKGLMIRNSNPLAQFVSEVLEQDNGKKVSKDLMYKTYCEYCNKNKLSPCSKEQLGRNLRRYAAYIGDNKSGSERYWLNVNFKQFIWDTWDTSENNMSLDFNSKKIKDISFKKVSQSPQNNQLWDTCDTSLQKEIKAIQKELEDEKLNDFSDLDL